MSMEMDFWDRRAFGKYLDGLKKIWNCDEEKAILTLCEAYYILRGYKPETAADSLRCRSAAYLEYVFCEIMKKTHPDEAEWLMEHKK